MMRDLEQGSAVPLAESARSVTPFEVDVTHVDSLLQGAALHENRGDLESARVLLERASAVAQGLREIKRRLALLHLRRARRGP